MHPAPLFSSSISEKRWVHYIARNYTIDLETLPCIFQVPQKLRNENPEAYTPRAVGLGPYHHLRPELQEMESQKRASVKSFLCLKDFQKFIQFVDEVPSKLPGINGERDSQSIILPYYDTYLDLESKTLEWILVIDGIFLLEFLKQKWKWENQRMVAEIMMLENQIPLVLLKDIREALKDTFPGVLDIILLNQFNCFCNEQSPLKLCQVSERVDAAFGDEKHLLHFLYVLIVENFTNEKRSAQESGPPVSGSSSPSGVNLLQAIGKVAQFARDMVRGVCSVLKQVQTQGLHIPGPINNVSKLLQQLEKTSDFYGNRDENFQHRLADKIDVPSVSQLHHIANIKFSRTDGGGIRNILFDVSKDTLYLPEITLDEASEIVLRNLVAYEAASKPAGSVLELAEYVDLMCGIIKSESDVKLLRLLDIIKGSLPDEQIVRIFNGINKTTQIPPEQTKIQRNVQKLSKLFQETLDPYSDKENDNQIRLTNKIEVPSATKLHQKANLNFACTNGGQKNIFLDEKRNTLYLPEINLGIRPKDAVKDLAASEPEYVDFMYAIIEFEDDAEFLRNIGILKGDENLTQTEIVDAFKEIGKSIQWPKQLSVVQETVQKLNKKFRNLRIVKAYKFMENSFAKFQSWIIRIFPTLVLMLLALQSFCEIYGCRARRSGYAAVPRDSSFGLDDSKAKLMMQRKVLG